MAEKKAALNALFRLPGATHADARLARCFYLRGRVVLRAIIGFGHLNGAAIALFARRHRSSERSNSNYGEQKLFHTSSGVWLNNNEGRTPGCNNAKIVLVFYHKTKRRTE